MRNYLFDRPVVTIAEKKALKRKKRRPFWMIPAAAAALGVGIFLGVAAFSGLWSEPAEPDLPVGDEAAAAEGEVPTQTTIPRAPVGDGTVLTLAGQGAAPIEVSEIYEKALPSLVSVQGYYEQNVSVGSGIIMSESGYILTNHHIIDGAKDAWIYRLDSGEGYPAKLVGWSEELDLAVLKIEAIGLTPAEFASSRELTVGDAVYALGNPLGYLYGSLTEGIVSAPTRSVTIKGQTMTLIQTTAPLNEGNSGGALLNEAGQVVGITTAKMSDNKGDVSIEGVGLALPISEVRGQINSIIANGRVITPRIGIMCYAVVADGLDGVMVESVTEGDPAAAAGIRPGDLITHANGISVVSVEELKDVLFDTGVGGEVTLSVRRGAEKMEIPVILVGETTG